MYSNLTVNSQSLVQLTLVVVLLIVGIIFLLRLYFKNRSASHLSQELAAKKLISGRTITKYPDIDVFRIRGSIFRVGLLLSLFLILIAFGWTTFEKDVYIPENALTVDAEIEIEPPRTQEDPPPPPPPPPPVIQEVPEELILEEDEPIFIDQDITEETVIKAPEVNEEAKEETIVAPPPPPPPPEEIVEEIFRVVEEMPRFPGCEDLDGGLEEKKNCAATKLLEYIYKNLKYPRIALENGIEGTSIVQFVVNKYGEIEDVTVVRDIGAGCGEAAKKVVESMNKMPEKWVPGRQRGKPVKVLFTLPVKFQLINS